MKAFKASGERVTVEQLSWITGCVALTLVAHFSALPIWVIGGVLACAALRLGLALRGLEAPPRPVRLAISILAIGGLYLQLRTFNGISAGAALLMLIAGLKLLETQTRRDIYVLTMIIYFLSLAALLQGESFWLLAYLIGVCWLTTSTLLRLTSAGPAGDWRKSVRYAGRLLSQALPLALAFWLFFPRFGGPLWQLPDDGHGATSGLSDSMSPGDISDLAASDEVAFRVRFSSGEPGPAERYWRGPVLHDFDGRAWHRTDAGPVRGAPLRLSGPAYHYTVSLEPNQHNWIFVLDYPSNVSSDWNMLRGYLTSDYMMVQATPVSQPLDVTGTSYPHQQSAVPLSVAMRQRDLRLPPGSNPRTRDLAQQMHAAHPDTMDYVRAVLAMFHDEPYFYTLTPPLLGAQAVDDFLFSSKHGFCGHYASAFAVLMRAAGIPARVVTGYQGGTFNPHSSYWILRQSDAHAWNEIWLEDRGWLRVDPTSMIAPERVDRGLNDLVVPGQAVTSRWQQRTTWLMDGRLRLDALRLLWRQRILGFDQSSQLALLGLLHIPEPSGEKLAILLALCLIGGMIWLTWQVGREVRSRPRDALGRAYETLCRRLAAVGLPRPAHEDAEAFATRIGAERPDLASQLTGLCRRYSDLRYAGSPSSDAVAAFIAAVRKFRPKRRAAR
jgi:transglutaminase-like putative cysteine protease